MNYFPIIPKDRNPMVATDHQRLPDFYMEDFSILGFRVSDCERAIQILDQHDFTLKRSKETIEVGLQGSTQMHAAMVVLTKGGLACEIADVAEGMYQG